MKRIHVNANCTALVFKNNALKRVLSAGSHWLSFGETVSYCDMTQLPHVHPNLDEWLQHEDFRERVTVLEVKDNQLVLLYRSGNFKALLKPGKYAIWKGIYAYDCVWADLANYEIGPDIDRNLLDKSTLAPYVRGCKVESQERALLVVDGQMVATLEAGQYYWWRNSSIIHLPKTDIRQLSMELNGQEILTRDKVQVRINFTLSYKVTDLELALLGNKEFDKQLYTMAQLALRAFTGTKSLDELMDSKDQVSVTVQAEVAPKAQSLGVTLVSCGVKDIILPGDVREIMNQVLIAEKRAQANTIMRREETAATRSLLNTARLMEDNAMLYKMKEMEYVEKVAEKINNISISGGGQLLDQLKQLLVRP